jgi:hypothetical protein
MTLKLNGHHEIENLRHYPAATVEKLNNLLAVGASAIPDPHRKGFYDVQNGESVYYIHVCPSGRILFLATWYKDSARMPIASPPLIAEACVSR